MGDFKRLVCGVDEAGRGPLAGPVYASAVILDETDPIRGLNDSKALSAKRREELSIQIKARAVAWAIARAEVAEIDEINILRASLLAMRRAVESLPVKPTEVLIDGQHCPELAVPTRAIVKGDSTVMEIAAASILAKTARDAEMLVLHEHYPHYGFDRHKGYPTAEHLEALRQYGASSVHRTTFAPVRSVLKARRESN
jgi:ribonuclease HII